MGSACVIDKSAPECTGKSATKPLRRTSPGKGKAPKDPVHMWKAIQATRNGTNSNDVRPSGAALCPRGEARGMLKASPIFPQRVQPPAQAGQPDAFGSEYSTSRSSRTSSVGLHQSQKRKPTLREWPPQTQSSEKNNTPSTAVQPSTDIPPNVMGVADAFGSTCSEVSSRPSVSQR
jgi:hypothetical protein